MLIEALERELARAEPDVLTDADGLDAMVESATGLAIGALAVEAPVVEGSPLEPGDTGLQSPAEAGVNVNDLPIGLSPDGVTATRYSPQAETPGAAASTTALEFRPYSTLEVRRHVPLVYPRRAVDGADGTLEVAFTVSESGQVVDVTVRSEAPAVFLRAAVETIQQWEFEPVRRDGEAVPVRTALRITYEG